MALAARDTWLNNGANLLLALGWAKSHLAAALGFALVETASEAETFWTAFLRTLARRGLRGVKLVISDAHEGLKAAVAKGRTWIAENGSCRAHASAPPKSSSGLRSPAADLGRRSRADRQTQHLAPAIAVDGDGDDHCHRHDAPVLADLHI
jgi:hypothetical protein